MDRLSVGPVSPDAQSFCPFEYCVGQPRFLAWTGVALGLQFQKQIRSSTLARLEHAVESGPLCHVRYYLDPCWLRQIVSGSTTGT